MSVDVEKYRQKAAVAADALRAALIAVEGCGADVELTDIVIRLQTDRTKLCLLFGLDPVQAFQTSTLPIPFDSVRSALIVAAADFVDDDGMIHAYPSELLRRLGQVLTAVGEQGAGQR